MSSGRALLMLAAVALLAGRLSAEDVRHRVILDTDANNELDDQHAIAYLLFDSGAWRVEGITTNRTLGGGNIDAHTAEAERVVKLCGWWGAVPVKKGASGSFDEIRRHLGSADYDGHEAVDFIVERARASAAGEKLQVIAIGKLTNVALALAKDPAIADQLRILWLGSNWPYDAGEYNERSDPGAVNAVYDEFVEMDVALVRYGVRGSEAGTAAVTVTQEEIAARMAGQGPHVAPVVGRHGGSFTCFGDYSVDLFRHVKDHERALFDVAGVAIAKNPAWAKAESVPAPRLEGKSWRERPTNPRRIRMFKAPDREAILADFFRVVRAYGLPSGLP
jgi:inosine-uridine preferring nucleoside hydrolase